MLYRCTITERLSAILELLHSMLVRVYKDLKNKKVGGGTVTHVACRNIAFSFGLVGYL